MILIPIKVQYFLYFNILSFLYYHEYFVFIAIITPILELQLLYELERKGIPLRTLFYIIVTDII